MSFDYIKKPSDIYQRSFAMIRDEVGAELQSLPTDIEPIVVRMIHGVGDTSIVANVTFSDNLVSSARKALAQGAPILCDANMIAVGVTRKRLPANNDVVCFLNHSGVSERAETLGTTRSAAALDLWLPRLEGAVVAIGNAPTALFYLLEQLQAGAPKPAAIIGLPVGFIGAMESKEALIDHACDVPYLTLRGRRGGSAMTVSALNALASSAE